MKSRLPNAEEIAELVAFLPRLYAPGFMPVQRWEGGTRDADGVLTLPWPEYDPVVEDFFKRAGADCWLDYEYQPEAAWQMLRTPELVESASLEQIKTMLTYCTRGERFADGHWAEMIEEGHIRRLLVRLEQLGATADA
jgi:hypothetical protein